MDHLDSRNCVCLDCNHQHHRIVRDTVTLDYLCSRMSSLKIALSSERCHIDNLPTEILVHIFTLLSKPHPVFDAKAFLHIAQLVCSRWREVAQCTPTLWNDLYIDSASSLPSHWPTTVGNHDPHDDYIWHLVDAKERAAVVFSTVLARSGSMSLSIVLDSKDRRRDGVDFAHLYCLDYLVPHSSRWQTLTIRHAFPEMLSVIKSVTDNGGSLDILEQLHLHLECMPNGTMPTTDYDLRLAAPKLHSLSVYGYLANHVLKIALPMSSLVHFASSLYDPSHILQGTKLESYESRLADRRINMVPSFYDVSRNIPSQSSALQTLVTNNPRIFEDFDFPKLRHIRNDLSGHVEAIVAMQDMLERSRPPLESLHIALDVASAGSFYMTLLFKTLDSCTPNLRRLSVRLRGLEGFHSLSAMLRELESGVALKHLEKVFIWVATDKLHRSVAWQNWIRGVVLNRQAALRFLDIIFVPLHKRKMFPEKETVGFIDAATAGQFRFIAGEVRIRVTARGNGAETRYI
ncbi:hypothetical protein BDZ89DRAFT_1082234 [Hymenopellis radicata]|nr:hypothetical protein BDZ89DRAFT_1082234 [Hymenopellis radicata]